MMGTTLNQTAKSSEGATAMPNEDQAGQPTRLTVKVALDGSPGSLAALRAGILVASALDALVVGVFVRDEGLYRLAQLPVCNEVRAYSTAVGLLTQDDMDRDMAGQRVRALSALRRLADQAQLAWRFEELKGRLDQVLVGAIEEADVVAVGRVGRVPSARRGYGMTTRNVVRGAKGITIVVEPGTRLRPPIFVLYDGCAAARSALEMGVLLANQHAASVTILKQPQCHTPMAARISEGVEVVPFHRDDPEALLELLPAAGGTVVLPARSHLASEAALTRLMANRGYAVVLVRRGLSERLLDTPVAVAEGSETVLQRDDADEPQEPQEPQG